MTLVILAAGMGSRFGGLKQIEPISENGEFIIDFSIYDACVSGFDKVVFIIKEENLEAFRTTIGSRFEGKIKVEYAFQRLDDIPKGYSVPEGREKPWGTGQALLAARELVDGPFAVINADDFYGSSAYALLFEHFSQKNRAVGEYCMVGYVLKNTLTENGSVSRGVCEVGDDGRLKSVLERTAIYPAGDVAMCKTEQGEIEIPLNAIVSMNCWGFPPDVFAHLQREFEEFLAEMHPNPLKCEFYLPFAVCDMLKKGICSVDVYNSRDEWYGITYKEDKESVVNSIAAMRARGAYPARLIVENKK